MSNQPLLFVAFLICVSCSAQNTVMLSGGVLNQQDKSVMAEVNISLEGIKSAGLTNADGFFQINVPTYGDFILNISYPDYVTKRIPIESEGINIDVGTIFLERDISTEQTDNLITLTDSEVLDDAISSNTSGLLQATRDIFLSRAAFDFGQAFFRVRGYDSQYGKVLLNGIPMNKFYDGRPQWNNWGGLNDATRNQQFTHGLQASAYNFGGILGTTNIDTRPSGLRPGTRFSSSASNRTYAGRLMVTHTSKSKEKGFTYSISASRRWAKQGYIDGTLYDAYSVSGILEYKFDKINSVTFTGILASNRRGRSSAITEEVFELVGKKYNPYWGFQNGEIRNSRERKIAEPILMLNHFYESKKVSLNTGVSYQFGTNYRSRLGYYNAPNPDPTYYRYLPSFYINSPIGANFISANAAKEGFLENPQLDWSKIYQANATDDKASYVLYDDVTNDTQFTASTVGNIELTEAFQFDFGLTYRRLKSDNFARIHDLFGSEYHEDKDPFSNTLNDINGSTSKGEKDIFNYNYTLDVSHFDAFAQLRYNRNKWDGFVSADYNSMNYQRNGQFQNERFPENSLGISSPISFANLGFKAGFTYRFNGRHQLVLNGALLNKPPTTQNIFINPRENNEIVPNLQNEKITATDFNYYIRLPKLTGRITAFYTRFQNSTDVNFFFVDSGVGSDFVQEVLTDLDKLHKGIELGFEYELSSEVKVTAVAAVGNYTYASNPLVAINFDTAGAEEDFINPEGSVDLGAANIKGYKLAQGPQKAFALGINYRDPKYWWIGATANYLADNYTNISTITRTASFFLDPETGNRFPVATDENVNKLLAQSPLDNFYLLNLVGGKSWLKKGKYISIFASVNNVFDTSFRTGGYEQSRNGNYGQLAQDNLSGTPSFAPKYWYGYGRTYFLNLAYSF
ncbi:carboxypeptidase-like regulatory domain-containing protein [Maribacter sp. 2308TA10-17]|uniref:carboxypeptidase-like regulatory domain-containing protein n=1 Tax=Maribacter sp. 2308TA10-17 TaxID=3386276 RepID=UPI0039BD24EA